MFTPGHHHWLPQTQESPARLDKSALAASPLVARVHAGARLRSKGLVDRLFAAVLLLPSMPLIGCLVLLIRLTSRGPGIFRQVRVGLDGRPYTMFKLRSMRFDAEVRTGPVWSTTDDPRVTRLGQFLRKSHLDELPQLFNVLWGEMALVGPRPERPEIVAVLAEAIPEYVQRLVVLPGVTGLAQINLPADTDLYSVRCKLVLDQQYIAEASLFFDLRILLCTALQLIGCPGDRAIRLMRVCREVVLPPGVDGHHINLGLLCPRDDALGNSDERAIADDHSATRTHCPGGTVMIPHGIEGAAQVQANSAVLQRVAAGIEQLPGGRWRVRPK